MAFQRYIELTVKGRIHGSDCINVYHFGTNEAAADNPALVLLLTNLASAMLLCIAEQLLAGVTSDYTLEEVTAKQLHPAVSDEIVVAAAANTDGGHGAINVSFETVLMRILTGGGGKSGRGRKFLPPPGDGAIANSVMDDNAVSNQYALFLQCLLQKFIGASATTPYRLGVLSQKILKATPGAYDTAFREAVNLAIEQRISCLRSRKLGSGS